MRSLQSRLRLFATGLLAAATLSACNVFDVEDKIAREARLVVTGESSVPLELVTSTKFIRSTEEDGEVKISLLASDTVFTDLSTPHDRIYPVKPDLGFMVRVTNHDTLPAVISMQVYFDGKLNYDQRDVRLVDSYLEYSFIFRNYNTIQ